MREDMLGDGVLVPEDEAVGEISDQGGVLETMAEVADEFGAAIDRMRGTLGHG